ncbi:hypothetical protein Pint_34118 [Pistacia integerrima]|uniref:Uncharacterized protein n=1 Tax=Pistacia integerrima TaxID=434235 RepID=A0ACC0X325_9ROSI|nr:hypothetical protein Pint_34118 [Pistacia integerrima]
MLTLPAIAGQALDPLAQLMETAYIGRIGSVELASAGVSISIFNIISKLFNFPLLSVATSYVAEEVSSNAIEDLTSVGIGIFEALALFLGSGPFLNLMGVPLGKSTVLSSCVIADNLMLLCLEASEMFAPAQRFLKLRALGAPAVVVSLSLNGIFRGFKDTKTPFICLGNILQCFLNEEFEKLSLGNLLAVFLFPIFINYCQMGITGAAISTVMSQYIVAAAMIWYLNKKVVLLPPKMGALKFGGYIKSGGFLLGRTLAVLVTMTLGNINGCSPRARCYGCTSDMHASLVLIASYISKGDFKTVREVTNFVLKIGVVTGVSLAAILGVSFGSLATLFTKDPKVLGIVRTGILFISATQPITALAFIFDGLHYGVSDFPYAACSMMLVGAISSAFLLYAPRDFGLPGVWSGLALFMALRMVAGFVRLLSKTGPWWFLHTDLEKAKVGRY